MTNRIWPASLRTPHIPLGGAVGDGFELLKRHGEIVRVEDENDTRVYRTNTAEFSVAIYERDGTIQSVWYDDPTGRYLEIGRQRKISLYLARYRNTGSWEVRMENGWMRYYFNDVDNLQMVYGIHADVIRFNLRERVLNSTPDNAATRQ